MDAVQTFLVLHWVGGEDADTLQPFWLMFLGGSSHVGAMLASPMAIPTSPASSATPRSGQALLPLSPSVAPGVRYQRLGSTSCAEIGHGSFGVVVSAWDCIGQVLVAVKQQPATSDDAAREMHFSSLQQWRPREYHHLA